MNVKGSTKIKESETNKAATQLSDVLFPSLACGMIFATTLFLIIPEAMFFIQRGTSSDKEAGIEILPGTTVRFGVAVMTGFMLPLVLAAVFPKSVRSPDSDSNSESSFDNKKNISLQDVNYDADEDQKETFSDEGDSSKEDPRPSTIKGSLNTKGGVVDSSYEDNPPTPKGVSFNETIRSDYSEEDEEKLNINMHLATFVVACDGLHNFFDGTFIGVAFLTCSYPTAICVTTIALYSEISQAMASYFILTNCGLISIPRSLLLIFCSGLAHVVGALLIISIGIGDVTIGVFLAFCAGVFLHLGAGECLPRVHSVVKKPRDRVFALSFFYTWCISRWFNFDDRRNVRMTVSAKISTLN